MKAKDWVMQAVGDQHDCGTPLAIKGVGVLATDRKRMHLIASENPPPVPEASDRVATALCLVHDDSRYREIEHDLWGPLTHDGKEYRVHLFVDVILDEKFHAEAIAGMGCVYTCAVWKDSPEYGPVRFRSADGKRTAYVMPFVQTAEGEKIVFKEDVEVTP